MRFLECIGKDAVVKDSVSLDRQVGVFPSNDKRKDELLQQKGFTKSLFNEGSISNGCETVMSHLRELVLDEDKEELACLNGQRKTDEIENHNFILMKSDEAVSQRDWTCDKEGGSSENEGETNMPHVNEETVLGLKKDELTTKISQ